MLYRGDSRFYKAARTRHGKEWKNFLLRKSSYEKRIFPRCHTCVGRVIIRGEGAGKWREHTEQLFLRALAMRHNGFWRGKNTKNFIIKNWKKRRKIDTQQIRHLKSTMTSNVSKKVLSRQSTLHDTIIIVRLKRTTHKNKPGFLCIRNAAIDRAPEKLKINHHWVIMIWKRNPRRANHNTSMEKLCIQVFSVYIL